MKELKVKFVDELETGVEVKSMIFEPEEKKEKHNRAKEHEETRKMIEEYYRGER